MPVFLKKKIQNNEEGWPFSSNVFLFLYFSDIRQIYFRKASSPSRTCKGEVARKHKRRTTSQTFPGSRGNKVHPAFFLQRSPRTKFASLALSPHKVSDILLPTKYLSFWLMSRSVQKIPFQAYQYKKAALKLGVPKPSIFFPRHWSGLWPL